ncbi:MAG: hypothetical protein N2544_07765 [Burkholderiales bacterium]|nr:hypothetical protein [Burkholderiales bacterium]
MTPPIRGTGTAVILLLLAALAGCAPFSLVTPERRTVGGAISVEPGMRWNRMEMAPYQGRVEVWTLDGPLLNSLVFFTGVPDGEPLFVSRALASDPKQEKPPVFRSAMNPLEIEELFTATIARNFRTAIVSATNLRPAEVAGTPGFRFETRFVGRDEVERAGVFVGTVRGGKLYGAWFQGARLHYYERYVPEVEKMAASARLVGEAASAR